MDPEQQDLSAAPSLSEIDVMQSPGSVRIVQVALPLPTVVAELPDASQLLSPVSINFLDICQSLSPNSIDSSNIEQSLSILFDGLLRIGKTLSSASVDALDTKLMSSSMAPEELEALFSTHDLSSAQQLMLQAIIRDLQPALSGMCGDKEVIIGGKTAPTALGMADSKSKIATECGGDLAQRQRCLFHAIKHLVGVVFHQLVEACGPVSITLDKLWSQYIELAELAASLDSEDDLSALDPDSVIKSRAAARRSRQQAHRAH